MQEWIIQISQSHHYLVYAIIIVLACAEGPILSMIFGVLIKLGLFGFIPIYAALMIGDLLGDIGWYYIGRRYGHAFIRRFGKYFSISEESVAKVTRVFHRYKHHILFLSKISNGFGFALVTLMTAGMIRIPFAKYIAVNLVGQFVWTGLLLGVGYFFGEVYTQVDGWLGRISVGVGFVLVIWALFGYKKYLAGRAERMDI